MSDPCHDHWHCDPVTSAHRCERPDRTKPCPTCAENPTPRSPMPCKFVLEIELGNEAMQNGKDVHSVLLVAAAQVREYSAEHLQEGQAFRRLIDRNGNTVGQWEVK